MSRAEYDRPIEGHEYDGIQELNNPLPRWWLVTFYGTIIFAVLYFGYYEILGGPSHDEKLARAMAKIQEQYAAANASAPAAAGEEGAVDVQALLSDPDALAVGKKHFDTKCMPCHGQHGEGVIGPNLTDDYWIHSRGDYEGILESFRKGFPDKGMPPWDALIPRGDQPKLAAYVLSLRGTHPPNAKAPQGEYVPRE